MQQRVTVGSLEVTYLEAGQGDRAFVLVHGFTGSSDDFADVLGDLGAVGRTLAPDNRGHGGTGHTPTYSLAEMVDDLAGWLDALGLERCDLLGHSLGGMAALRFTLAHPERVQSLVLMDTAAAAAGSVAREGMRAAAGLVGARGMRGLFEAMRKGASARWPDSVKRTVQEMGEDRYWERIERKLEAMDPQAFVQLSEELTDQRPVLERLGEITCPTLVLVGEDDTPFREPSEAMTGALPDARLVVVPDAAHSPQFENRGAWLEAVHAHLARARGG